MLEATKVIEISLFSRIQGRVSRFAEGCLGCIDHFVAPELVNQIGVIKERDANTFHGWGKIRERLIRGRK